MSESDELVPITSQEHSQRCKVLFLQRRREFKALNAGEELSTYAEEKKIDYKKLLDLWPTVFTHYAERFPENVLSATNHSLIISNVASHDKRLYSQDAETGAGMSFVHLLVIPRGDKGEQRGSCIEQWLIPNSHSHYSLQHRLSLDGSWIITEMQSHSRDFWSQPDSVDIIIQAVSKAHEIFVRKENLQLSAAAANSDTEALKAFQENLRKAEQSRKKLTERLRTVELNLDDFFFGFHCMPNASVGYLHMHVILTPRKFRKHITHRNDWKTIPADVVIEVIDEEKRRDSGHDG
ncbi:hypothetical protein D9758_014204 [Tetrapyrgos nigripes]|uniref:HIT domain-containing protein n=1 Tax=Tetrapyrgos nigripes TaxID=182062 RepID=A0A8H5CW32_9AGAR|nr:hypothetical protein D9758_014204 [Tetrapyrgos nigripes]